MTLFAFRIRCQRSLQCVLTFRIPKFIERHESERHAWLALLYLHADGADRSKLLKHPTELVLANIIGQVTDKKAARHIYCLV